MTHRSTPWLAALLLAASGTLGAQTLRVGLAEDPDVLDPTLARTFVVRIVFAALCDKLVEVDEKLAIQPQLAQSWEWSADNKSLTMKLRPGVTFHDGEKLDAAAVKFNLERHKNQAGSNRRGELAPVASVDVVDPLTVKLNLSAPFSPLLAQLADRAGMMVSPKAAQARFAMWTWPLKWSISHETRSCCRQAQPCWLRPTWYRRTFSPCSGGKPEGEKRSDFSLPP